jgi:hypothetical protein
VISGRLFLVGLFAEDFGYAGKEVPDGYLGPVGLEHDLPSRTTNIPVAQCAYGFALQTT